MNRNRRIFIAKSILILSVIPVLIWAYAAGPDVGKAGVPGESTCAEAGCHTGTAVNSSNGNVAVTFPSGMTYTPGVKQHLVVTVTDTGGGRSRFGFQLTARQAANTATQAGSFTSTDANTSVFCGATPTDLVPTVLNLGSNQECPAAKPLAYIEHRQAAASQTFEFDWTPPATNVGDVRIYVAGNAANGNTQVTGDRIYTANYTLTPAAGGSAPTISSNGVVNGASFQPGVVPNSWITIQGTNLSTTTRTWDGAIVDGRLPESLDGVSVMVGDKRAYVYFISPTQINVVAPDTGTGSMSVTVTNSGGASTAAAANASTVQPAFFLWPNNQPVATRQDFSLAVKNGTFSGTTTVPAKPEEVIILWGTGFGPTNPAAPIGVQIPSTPIHSTANPVTVTVGGSPAEVFGAVLSPGFAALYQVAIRIPASAPNGDLPVVATIGGTSSPTSTVITVQR